MRTGLPWAGPANRPHSQPVDGRPLANILLALNVASPVRLPNYPRKAAIVHIGVAYAAVPMVIGIGMAVTSCGSAPGTVKSAVPATRSASATVSGSPTASPAGSSSAAPVPAGYTRVGSAAQGISVAAPTSWVAIDLAKETIESAASKAGLSGVSATTLVQAMTSLQKMHAVLVFDVKYAVDSPDHFAPNLSAYCVVSGVTDVGAAGVPLLKQTYAAEYGKLGATHLTQRQLEVGGVAGVETSYQLNSSTAGTIYGSQLEVLPKPDKVCFVTVTSGKGAPEGTVVSTAAATAQFP
jgi:hypothetical protein